MLTFLYETSWPISVGIILILSLMISTLLTTIFRCFYPTFEKSIDKEIHIKTIDINAIMLGLLLGFAVLISQNSYDSANDATQSVADLIRNALRNAKFFDAESQKNIDAAFKDYVHYLTQEWKHLGRDEVFDEESPKKISKIQDLYFNIPIKTDKEKIIYDLALNNLDQINNKNSSLHQLANSSLHPVIWLLLCLFSTIIIIFILTYPISNAIYDYLLTFTYISIISILMLFIFLLEYPFSGEIHIDLSILEGILQDTNGKSVQ